ncbi:MAG: glycerophosphodiester phosphodiesterase, partial [Betaproteobacteria bacterium]
LATAAGLRDIAHYAHGVGPHKNLVIERTPARHLGAPTRFVADAHAAGLLVHAWTFRAENAFLPAEFRHGDAPSQRGDAQSEMLTFLRAGIDGLFTDQADIGVAARAALPKRAD